MKMLPFLCSSLRRRGIRLEYRDDKLLNGSGYYRALKNVLKKLESSVTIEGVFKYLEEGAIGQLIKTLRRLFPRHKLICDLMTRDFFENYGKTVHEKLTGIGASFKFTVAFAATASK